MIECKSELSVDKLLRELRSEKFNKMALERSTEEVFSSDKEGSTILLLRALFKNYNQSVKILGTSLCDKIINDEECLKRMYMVETPVKIILTHSSAPKNLGNYLNNGQMIHGVNVKEMKSYVIQNTEKKLETDFLVLDDLAYFVELTDSKLARCSFNNIEGALNLSKRFDEIYNNY
jgi:hypothetical protein